MSVFVFFFKQKTAYELRISDWSSDVCSSDLADRKGRRRCEIGSVSKLMGKRYCAALKDGDRQTAAQDDVDLVAVAGQRQDQRLETMPPALEHVVIQIGRASCRERVCQYV